MKFSSCLRRFACLRVWLSQEFCRFEDFVVVYSWSNPTVLRNQDCGYSFGNQSIHIKVNNNKRTYVDPFSLVVTTNQSLDSSVY